MILSEINNLIVSGSKLLSSIKAVQFDAEKYLYLFSFLSMFDLKSLYWLSISLSFLFINNLSHKISFDPPPLWGPHEISYEGVEGFR